jgi:4-amino-4-deoxy-L-arabinose transferase-like glycosyltransferase
MTAPPPPAGPFPGAAGRATGLRQAASRLLPVALVAAALASGLDSPSGGTHPDERLYLSLANEMQTQGTWLTPTLEGRPDFTKPPLLYWAARASLELFGSHLWSARLPVVVCALLLSLTAGRLARRFGGEAAWARGVLLVGTCLGMLRYGRLTMMDVPLALALALAVEAAWTAAEERRPGLLLWVGLAAGLSSLLKGPVGPILVLGICSAVVAVRAPGLLRTGWAAAGLATTLLVGLPWFLLMVGRHGWPFVERFILVENFGKFTVPWTLAGEGRLLLALVLLALPWVGLVQWRANSSGLRRMAGLWLGAVLLVFSLPGLKQVHYLVPCLLPLLLLAAVPPLPRPVAARATATLLALAGLTGVLALRIPLPLAPRCGLAGVAMLLGLAAVALWRCRTQAAALGYAAALVLTFALLLPALNPASVPQQVWQAVGSRPLALWRQEPGLLALLAHRPIHRVNDAAETARAVAEGTAVALPARDFDVLPPEVRNRLEPVTRWPRLRSGFGPAELFQALWAADLAPLQEGFVLVVGTPQLGRP